MITVRENLAKLFPLHFARIVELTRTKELLDKPSCSRWHDLAGLFVFSSAEEGREYWWSLATADGVR